MAQLSKVYFDRLAVRALHEGGRRIPHMLEQRGVRDRAVWNQVSRGLRSFTGGAFETLPWLNRSCMFCRIPLLIIERVEQPPDEDSYEEILAALELCLQCRYWRWHFLDSYFEARGGSYAHHYISYVSKLKEFSPTLPEGCSVELAQWLRRRPDAWIEMNPNRLERFVAHVFRANYESCEVTHVGGSGDGGVDVLLIESSGQQWLVQVKRRSRASRGEGVETVRNLLGAMLLHTAKYGIVVSTADHFTYQARLGAAKASSVGMRIDLVDRGILNRMLEPVLPSAPWVGVITSRFPNYAAWLATQTPALQQIELFPREPRSVSLATNERLLFLDDAGIANYWYDDHPQWEAAAK